LADALAREVLLRAMSMIILKICTKTAAQYPRPTPLDEIFVDNCSSGEEDCEPFDVNPSFRDSAG
jgi:hypothetical protein